jgi:hypothetical protein
MGVEEEAKEKVGELLGEEIVSKIKESQNPAKDPKEFLDECLFILGKLIGEDAAKKKFEDIYKKYTEKK